MKTYLRKALVAGGTAAALMSTACATAPKPEPEAVKESTVTQPVAQETANPLTRPWSGPHGGVPAFDQVKVEHFVPALNEAMDAYRKEIAAIASQQEAPTFENTIEALERSGRIYRTCGPTSASGPRP